MLNDPPEDDETKGAEETEGGEEEEIEDEDEDDEAPKEGESSLLHPATRPDFDSDGGEIQYDEHGRGFDEDGTSRD